MILAAIGVAFGTMVGPLEAEPSVRISRPGGGPPEVIREVAGGLNASEGIEVPGNAVAGGAGVTVVGAEAAPAEEAGSGGEAPLALYTEQLFRAFGYDRDHFGYAYVDYPGMHRWHGGERRGERGRVEGPRRSRGGQAGVRELPRDMQPIESRFPTVVPGR